MITFSGTAFCYIHWKWDNAEFCFGEILYGYILEKYCRNIFKIQEANVILQRQKRMITFSRTACSYIHGSETMLLRNTVEKYFGFWSSKGKCHITETEKNYYFTLEKYLRKNRLRNMSEKYCREICALGKWFEIREANVIL